jgi:hypothetical protein
MPTTTFNDETMDFQNSQRKYGILVRGGEERNLSTYSMNLERV